MHLRCCGDPRSTSAVIHNFVTTCNDMFIFSYILNYVVYKAKINYHQHNSKTDYSITILKCQGTCPGIMIYSGKDVQIFWHLNFASVWPVLQISLLFDEEFSHHSPCNNDPLLWISSAKPWFQSQKNCVTQVYSHYKH